MSESFPKFKRSDRALEISPGQAFEVYHKFYTDALIPCARVSNSLPFWIGDFVNYGEATYGDKYTQVIDATDYEYTYLRNLAYICRNVPPENRNAKLGVNYHYAVARMALGDQVEMLEQAAHNKWSVGDLRAEIQKFLPGEPRSRPTNFKSFYNDYITFNVDASTDPCQRHMRAAFTAGQEVGK